MKSASSPRTTPAASADGAASASAPASVSAPQSTPTPAAGTTPRRRPRWRLIAGALLTFGLCLGAALLVKREQQRQAALYFLEDCGCKAMAWHSPWGRVPSSEALDWDELRSRTFLYPDVIITPEVYFGTVEDLEDQDDPANYRESDPREDSETDEEREASEDRRLLKDLHKSDPLKLLAALQVLQPKMLIMRWSQPQAPAFWRRLAQVTSLEGLMVTAWWGGFDDRALQHITRLPRLSVLVVSATRTTPTFSLGAVGGIVAGPTKRYGITGITDAGLTCLESCPQLKTLTLEGTHVTREGALACLRLCPHLQLKLNGHYVSLR